MSPSKRISAAITRKLCVCSVWPAGFARALSKAVETFAQGLCIRRSAWQKTDLTTELVKEFTELQGIVGGLYARVQELDEGMPEANRQAIATAVYDQYKPESMERFRTAHR
jgi:glycyl-tRNA synthetase beta chain